MVWGFVVECLFEGVTVQTPLLSLRLCCIYELVIVVSIKLEFSDSIQDFIGTSDRFSHIQGILTAYLVVMGLVWTHGSFFEELLFRAFIINHTSEAFGGGERADIWALLISSIFFGYRHAYYQGIHGALVTGAAGFAFGLLYLWFGRKNILPLIFAHGIFNTLGQTFRFLGIEDLD